MWGANNHESNQQKRRVHGDLRIVFYQLYFLWFGVFPIKKMCDSGVDPNSIVAGGSAAGYAEETSFSQAFLGRITGSQS